jgi:hypothetical protein
MIELIVVLSVVALLLLPALFGFDSRDGMDWQERQGWNGPRR